MPDVSSLSDSLLLNIQLRLYIRSLHKWDQWEPIKNEIIYCIKQCLLVHATQVAFTRLPDDQEHWADTIGFLATCFIEGFSSNFTLKTIQINKHSITEIMIPCSLARAFSCLGIEGEREWGEPSTVPAMRQRGPQDGCGSKEESHGVMVAS